MRFRGRDYDGTGVVAVIDSGINASDPRLNGAAIEGWSIQLSATGQLSWGPIFRMKTGMVPISRRLFYKPLPRLNCWGFESWMVDCAPVQI